MDFPLIDLMDGIVEDTSLEGTAVNTDDWKGYSRLGTRQGRTHHAVDHSGPKGTWAMDLDGDGLREVYCNTQEGLWTGLRIFLSRFRGVSRWSLDRYVAMFRWAHNIKRATHEFPRSLLGMRPSTGSAP
jgi:hypothetical protein